jgi:DNA repair protein RecO (recombination protein O)
LKQSTHEGIVLRLVKTTGGKRMVTIFTKDAGKLGAGTNISEKSKSKSTLAIRPFSRSEFHIEEKGAGYLRVKSADLIESHFALSEDPDKYSEGSLAIEFTDRLLPDGIAAADVYALLSEHLRLLCLRKKNYRLLSCAFLLKVLDVSGVLPDAGGVRDGALQSNSDFDILDVIEFLRDSPLEQMGGLMLEEAMCDQVFAYLRGLAAEHLGIGYLKSDALLK